MSQDFCPLLAKLKNSFPFRDFLKVNKYKYLYLILFGAGMVHNILLYTDVWNRYGIQDYTNEKGFLPALL